MHAFQNVVGPIARERCQTNLDLFVRDNIDLVVHWFALQARRENLGPAETGTWFFMHNIAIVVNWMLDEALKQEHGKWQWRGFTLAARERDECQQRILHLIIDASAWDEDDKVLGEWWGAH